MAYEEDEVWNRLNNAREIPLEADWLGQAYSPKLSIELRQAIANQLGLLSAKGWKTIELLIKVHGKQEELIHAAGISHQPGAKTFLLSLLQEESSFRLDVLCALTCWGSSIPKSLLQKILNAPEQSTRLAGIELLKFKAHKLSNKDILKLTQDLLIDFRDPIVINTLKVLQRREGVDICKAISQVALKGSPKASDAAVIALGSIGTIDSLKALIDLEEILPEGNSSNLVMKQISHQYRFLNQSLDQERKGGAEYLSS